MIVEALRQWIEMSMRLSMHALIRHNQRNGLSQSQMTSLIYLSREPKPSVNMLASRLGVSKAAASQMVERLVEQGWVERQEDPLDRRSKVLLLTEAGRAVMHASGAARTSWIEGYAATLTAEEVAILLPALRLLNEKLEPFAAEGKPLSEGSC